MLRLRNAVSLFSLLLLTIFGMNSAASAQCERPQMLLIVDKSSSMLGELEPGLSKWDAAVTALGSVTGEFADNIDFGLSVFPRERRCEPGEVVVDVGRRSSADILAGLGSPPPSGGSWTPMAATLDVAADYAPLQDGSRENVVVLITDGWEWCDPYNASTRFNVVESVSDLRAQGVTVFVIGFGESVDAVALNRAATAAGTARAGCDVGSSDPSAADNCYLSALDEVSLREAIGRVAGATAAEECDGIDDDCDTLIDEDFDTDGDGFTTCGTRTDTPGAPDPGRVDCRDDDGDVFPTATEVCDGVDNDCDGETDPGCDCTFGETRACGSDVGACMAGTQECLAAGWGECVGAVNGTENEACNAVDEDCDGVIDEDAPCPEGSLCDDGRCVDFTEPPPADLDTDGDGLLDEEECPGGRELDSDEDGIPDCEDPDDDNDGILTINERPSRMNVDTDGDGRPNHLDPDDDNDGVPTLDERPGGVDAQTDEDGVPDHLDVDDDNDGQLTSTERPGGADRDTDGNGTPDHLDPDDDGDTLPTRQERPGEMDTDFDADGMPNHLDPDDDNDTIPTQQERQEDTTPDDDYDDDGSPSYLDTDADADGVDDIVELDGDDDGDGAPNYLADDGLGGGGLGYAGGGAGCSASGTGAPIFALFMAFLFLPRRRRD